MTSEITVEQFEWTHPPRPGHVDHRGHIRWVVLDDKMVVDHFATKTEADAAADQYATDIDED